MVKYHAFTSKWNGLARQIKTQVFIKSPLDETKISENIIALWDTGATGTVISSNIVKELGLITTGKITSNGVNGPASVNTYIIDVILPNKVCIESVTVSESAHFGGHGFDVLIGMDIISLGDFAITNEKGITVFSYQIPSSNEIDFVPEAIDNNMRADGLNRKQRRAQKKKRT